MPSGMHGAGESPYPTLLDIVRSGDRRASLEALRDHLAARLDDDPHPRDAAPLAQRLADVLATLADLPESGGKSVVDELTAKRARRQAEAAAPPAAAS